MTIPRATYRLQFREGMTFARAATLAPYVRRLGVSHIYASPVFAAVRGSTHGYDVTDLTTLDPDLGGEDQFGAMAAAFRAEALGLIIDFVPNHMAASVENPWWRDTLRQGQNGAFARHFDIDWDAGPVTLPVLPGSFEHCAENREFALEPDAERFALAKDSVTYPINDSGVRLIRGAMDAGTSLIELAADPAFLVRLHELQFWRLCDWRSALHRLTYRRFFEITGLVGLRVEDPQVFDHAHAKLFELVDRGLVHGIRLDHIDGLADPAGYLSRLRRRVGNDVFLVVEKILAGDEHWPSTWRASGTTGYEFIDALARFLTTDQQATALDEAYGAVDPETATLEARLIDAKREIITNNLAAELETLTRLAQGAANAAWPEHDWGNLKPAVAATASSVPVYRAYVDASGPTAIDRTVIATIARGAAVMEPDHGRAIKAVERLLTLDVPSTARSEALAFAVRFQQTTGAVMAKAVEDTLFYRYNRLIGLNEVGGDLAALGGGVEDWHDRMSRRSAEQPHGLSTTATHDTKRGEDARARLYTISEAPHKWRDLVRRWSRMVPSPPVDEETRWLLFQALLGLWPADADQLADGDLRSFAERFVAYTEKAVREAKRHTSWTEPNRDFEDRVRGFAAALWSERHADFREDFARAVAPFIRAGAVNSLTQLAFKLTAPGVPDIYQGTEAWDLSLVDPDNRRPPDFGALARFLERAEASDLAAVMKHWPQASPKAHLLARGLALRAAKPDVFAHGTYRPLPVEGPARAHVVAFAREYHSAAIVTVAVRCAFGRIAASGPLSLEPGWLAGTTVEIGGSGDGGFSNVITGEVVRHGKVDLGALLQPMPVAMLITPPDGFPEQDVTR